MASRGLPKRSPRGFLASQGLLKWQSLPMARLADGSEGAACRGLELLAVVTGAGGGWQLPPHCLCGRCWNVLPSLQVSVGCAGVAGCLRGLPGYC